MRSVRQISTSARVAVYFPGQAIKIGPDIESIKKEQQLTNTVKQLTSALHEAVGIELAVKVIEGNVELMRQDTQVAQLRSFYESMIMWMAFLKTSFNGEPPVEKLIGEGLLKIQVAGDSCGGVTAAFAPGPGNVGDQLERVVLGLKAMAERGKLMLNTPHDPELGGMAAVAKILPFSPLSIGGPTVHELARQVNKILGQDGLMCVVKYNSPRLTVVAGPRNGLDLMKGLVEERKGLFFGDISPYWFHHPMVMEAFGKMFGTYMADPKNIGEPSPLLQYVSNVTGRVILPRADAMGQDLASGVWKAVRIYTPYLPSVHGTAHKNGFLDAIVFNQELVNWLRPSGKVATHLATDFATLGEKKTWLMRVIKGEVRPGKAPHINEPAAPSPQLLRKPIYQA